MAEITITKENFEQEVLKSDIPVLIDFWAVWCGPCKMMAPVVAQIAEENEGVYKVGKVNVDEEQELAAQFGIMSIPSFIVFKDGEAKAGTVGVQPKDNLIKLLQK
ncbi:MAG: thioredoxin [Solobacterium sp.]|nr:thioredoxin [Solobacterium sp.]